MVKWMAENGTISFRKIGGVEIDVEYIKQLMR